MINSTVESFFRVLEESNQVDYARQNKLLEVALTKNQGIAPTEDLHGRLHAPFEGYYWGNDVYHAGSYLSNEFDSKHVQDCKTRFKTDINTANQLKDVFKNILTVSTGKSWTDGSLSICYCYIQGLTETQLKNIKSIILELESKLKSDLILSRGSLEEGKQDLTITVLSSFTKPNFYTNDHDLKLNVTNKGNISAVINVTNKMWDLVDVSIDELIGKEISLIGTVKAVGENKYQINRPSKIKLV